MSQDSQAIDKTEDRKRKAESMMKNKSNQHSRHYSSHDLAQAIDRNSRDIKRKVNQALGKRNNKRKMVGGESRKRKRQQTHSVNAWKGAKLGTGPSMLSCFVLGHPWMIAQHIHMRYRPIKRPGIERIV